MFRKAGVPIERRTTAPAPSAVSILRTFLAIPLERRAIEEDMAGEGEGEGEGEKSKEINGWIRKMDSEARRSVQLSEKWVSGLDGLFEALVLVDMKK